jgi:glycosyltransferase involved in cell wall biosynthesis
MKLSIVIPSFNEAKTLPKLLSRLFATSFPGWEREVIVVDDASQDDTPAVLSAFADQITVLRLPVNSGKGSAVAAGLARATGEYVLIQDADLEYSPEEIPRLLKEVNGARSVVYGSRNLLHDPQRDIYWVPRLGVWAMTNLINLLFRTKLTDVWTCYKLFPASARALFPRGGFDAEIRFTLELCRAGYQIAEVPISHRPRTREEGKKIRYRDGLLALADIVSYWARSSKIFLGYLGCVVLLIAGSYVIFQPVLGTTGDGSTYFEAMQVLYGAPPSETFVPNRLVTSSLGLITILAVGQVSGVLPAWILLNMVYLLLMAAVWYALLKLLFDDRRVAVLGGLFLMGNYAPLVFGVHYLMDAGGWALYVISLYFLARYARYENRRDIYYAALAAGIGGIIKEYALLGAVAFGLYLVWEHGFRIGALVRRMTGPSIVVLAPLFTVALIVFQYFGYSYVDWFSSNAEYYVYSSRIIEYIKAGGALVNLLGPLALVGAYLLVTQKLPDLSRRMRVYIWCVIGSALPVLVWPAITQRVLFAAMPAVVLLAAVALWHYRASWRLFCVLLLLYIAASFAMNAFILPFVNLPF